MPATALPGWSELYAAERRCRRSFMSAAMAMVRRQHNEPPLPGETEALLIPRQPAASSSSFEKLRGFGFRGLSAYRHGDR